jgi:hypothetical protein
MTIFYVAKTSSNVKRIEETCNRGRRSSPTVGCPSARTPRPGITKTERDLDHLQDHGEQALTDLNLKVYGDDGHMTGFWSSVCLFVGLKES